MQTTLAEHSRSGAEYLPANSIYCGDSRLLLPRIRPESISLSFWSPPYFVGKSYERDLTFEDWKSLIQETIALHFEVVVPGGFLAINIADILSFPDPEMPRIQADNISSKKVKITREEILEVLKKQPGLSRYQLADLLGCSEQTIDRRLNNNNVRGGKYETQRKVKLVGGLIEEWITEAGFYLYDRRVWVKDPCWENSKWHSLSYRSVDEFEYVYICWKPGITRVDRSRLSKGDWSAWGSRSVWNIPSVRANEEHESQFPLELARRVVRLLSSEGSVVLDCFVGSGTTAVASIMEGRSYIGIELLPHYAELARQNCLKALESRDSRDFRTSQ